MAMYLTNQDHLNLRRSPGSPWSADKYIGTVGALAVALGIGTASIACAACATADTGDSSSSSESSSSRPARGSNVGASRTPKANTIVGPSSTPGASASTAAPAADVPAIPTVDIADSAPIDLSDLDAAVTPRRGATRATTAQTTADSPDAGPVADLQIPANPSNSTSTSPAASAVVSTIAAQTQTATESPLVATVPQAPLAAAAVPATATTLPTTATTSPISATVVVPQAAAAVAAFQTPQAAAATTSAMVTARATAIQTAIESFTTKIRALLASFTNALSGKSPAVEGVLALLFGTAKREETADLEANAGKPAATNTTSATNATTSAVEAEKFTFTGLVKKATDSAASGKSALVFTGSGSATTTINIPESTALTITAKNVGGVPNMTVSIDGVVVTTLLVETKSYSTFTFAGKLAAGKHEITVSTTTSTPWNTLYVDKLVTTSGPIVDEFNGKSGAAPSNMWTVRVGSQFVSDNASYAAGNATLDGQGHLVLQATKDKQGRYVSGWVWSKNNMSFGYGTITARIKMPSGQGLWPSVWLMGADSDTVGWPQSGEIDIVELPSSTTAVHSTLHGPIAGTTDNQQAQLIKNLPDLSTDYHNYWVTHLENSITFGVDNITLGTLTPADLAPGSEWVYNRPMYMVMNLSVGGQWVGEPDKTTKFPAKMIVDSVRFDAA